jgi:hypothetical protein
MNESDGLQKLQEGFECNEKETLTEVKRLIPAIWTLTPPMIR